MGFGAVIAGLIFLFNPVIHVVDILPDAIGFFLIVGGLTKMSYFIDKIAQARDLFWKLAFVEVVKFFSIAFIPYTTGSALVLMAFVFGCIELVMFLPAVNALFEGISFAGLWYGGTAMYTKKSKKQRENKKEASSGDKAEKAEKAEKKEVEYLTSVKRYIIFFYIFRICATLVPELTELQMYDYLGEVSATTIRSTDYKPFLYVVTAFAVIVLGIIFIKKVVSFFGAIRKDKLFIDNMKRKYTDDILPKETFFLAKNMKRAMMLFSLSAVTSFMIYVDGVNVFVGIFSAALLIAAALIVKRYNKLAGFVIPIAVVRAVLSVVNFIQQVRYFAEYTEEAVDYIDTAYNMYYTMAITECVEYVFALAAVLLFLTALMKAVKAHLEICGIQTDNAQYSKRNRDLETYNTIGGKLLLTSILAIINYAFDCSYHYLLPNMSMMGVLAAVISLIYIAYSIYTVSTINTLLYDKEIELS